ncbi:MAG: energy transducer TonB [Betaproteobacteria bacterium]|nr:energy transducer TonB [Betaproteobacteria bacterium]
MNGRFSSFSAPDLPQSLGLRLALALLASAFLHALVIYIPYAGESRMKSRHSEKGGQKPPRIISATLVAAKKTPATIAPAALGNENISKPADTSSPGAGAVSQPAREQTVGAGVLPVAAPVYYPIENLTKRPQPIGAADLDQPETRVMIASGKIALKLWIDESGKVIKVTVEKTDLPEMIVRSTVEAFKKLRFVPGEINRQRVGSEMKIEVDYDDGRLPPKP